MPALAGTGVAGVQVAVVLHGQFGRLQGRAQRGLDGLGGDGHDQALGASPVRYGRDEDFIAEAVQRVRVKLLVGEAPRIVEYGGRGPLAAWIQIVAIREALMMMRGQRREVSADDELVRLAVTEPVLARSRQVYKGAFAQAFREALAELDERERTLLRLCFGEGIGTEDLARLFRIHRVTAFRWLRDARAHLLELTRTRFLAAAEIPPSEIDSVMRSLASSLSVTW